MIFILDNYDSFTYNLYQYLGELGAEVEVARNDALSVAEVMDKRPAAVVVSPGPGRPRQAGISMDLIAACAAEKLPLLGVCLGHQALGEVFGATVEKAALLMHGKTSVITHDGKTIFAGAPEKLTVMRYHSLLLREGSLPADVFEVSAVNQDDGEIMAIRHQVLPLEGVQFHPESIMTPEGKMILKNFINFYL